MQLFDLSVLGIFILKNNLEKANVFCKKCGFLNGTTQSRIIGAVRRAHSQLWGGTFFPVCSLYAARKYDRRFGTPAIV